MFSAEILPTYLYPQRQEFGVLMNYNKIMEERSGAKWNG